MDLFIHFLDSRPISGACVRFTLLYRSYWSLLKVRIAIMSGEEQPRWSDVLKRRLANSNKGESTETNSNASYLDIPVCVSY